MQMAGHAEAFSLNLSGEKLRRLRISQLPQLGVHTFEQQKTVMRSIEQLLDAHDILERCQFLNQRWAQMGYTANMAVSKVRRSSTGDTEQEAAPEQAHPQEPER